MYLSHVTKTAEGVPGRTYARTQLRTFTNIQGCPSLRHLRNGAGGGRNSLV